MNHKFQSGFLTLPLAIVLAAVIVAGALIYTVNPRPVNDDGGRRSGRDTVSETVSLDNLAPVTASDHILGDIKAPVKIVEFSDTECPFCKQFHYVMMDIMEEYGSLGKVAWVYRHFPIDSLHPKARQEATALECAAAVGGNEKFWLYVDRLFDITPSNNDLDLKELPNIATYVGLDRAGFESCLSSSRFADKIQNQYDEAVSVGGDGTPYSILIAPDGQRMPIRGSKPYATIKQMIESALDR